MSKTNLDIARLIPAVYRKKILEDNIIYKAVAIASDPHMKVLFEIWKQFIEPGNTSLSLECSYCVANIYQNFTAIKTALIELEKADKYLEL